MVCHLTPSEASTSLHPRLSKQEEEKERLCYFRGYHNLNQIQISVQICDGELLILLFRDGHRANVLSICPKLYTALKKDITWNHVFVDV